MVLQLNETLQCRAKSKGQGGAVTEALACVGVLARALHLSWQPYAQQLLSVMMLTGPSQVCGVVCVGVGGGWLAHHELSAWQRLVGEGQAMSEAMLHRQLSQVCWLLAVCCTAQHSTAWLHPHLRLYKPSICLCAVQNLVHALADIAAALPDLLEDIQGQLLDLMALILSGK